jgi:hypothetical protein
MLLFIKSVLLFFQLIRTLSDLRSCSLNKLLGCWLICWGILSSLPTLTLLLFFTSSCLLFHPSCQFISPLCWILLVHVLACLARPICSSHNRVISGSTLSPPYSLKQMPWNLICVGKHN